MAGQSSAGLIATVKLAQVPATPRTGPSSDALSRIILHLKDDLEVVIALPEQHWSPARSRRYPGHQLYIYLKYLFYKAPRLLDRLVNEFETDCEQDLFRTLRLKHIHRPCQTN
jgi:hypothetical protein